MVTLNSWVYMVCGVLTLLQLQGARLAGEKTAVLLGMVLLVTVGFGLLMRLQWARWVAVGMSLLTWLLGSLGLALLVIFVFRAYARARNPTFAALFGVLLVLGIAGVILWFNKRLYEYLTSDEGRKEFHAPEDETHLTSKSSAAYVAYLVVVAVLTTPGMKRTSIRDLGLAMTRDAMARAEESQRAQKMPDDEAAAAESLPGNQDSANSDEAARDQMEPPTARMEESVERANPSQQMTSRAEDRRIAQEEFNRERDRLLQRRMSDPAYSPEQTSADLERAMTRLRDRIDAGAAASSTHQDDKPKVRVLRCRDSAGAVIFTQNYCPAGSQLVE